MLGRVQFLDGDVGPRRGLAGAASRGVGTAPSGATSTTTKPYSRPEGMEPSAMAPSTCSRLTPHNSAATTGATQQGMEPILLRA